MDAVRKGSARYCVACGSLAVEITREASNVKDPEHLTVKCTACGYLHEDFIPSLFPQEGIYTSRYYKFLDTGSNDPEHARVWLNRFAMEAGDCRDIIAPFLARLRGVDEESLGAALAPFRRL